MPLPSITARLPGAGTPLPLPRLSRRGGFGRRAGVIAAVVAVALVIGIYVLLRMTPLSAVQQVTVVGVEGPKASSIRHALERAAHGQSTLGFDASVLRDVVSRNESITGIDVHARFPHAVQLEVHQRLAVAAIASGGRRVAVAADGTLLPDWASSRLPLIKGGSASDGRLDARQRAATTILAAAPAPLLAKAARVDATTTVRLADGPALLFRDASRVNAKWAAAVAVLSDPKSVGATWIDLRVPEQPVAGRGAPPVLPGRDALAEDLTTAPRTARDATGATAPAEADGAVADGASAPVAADGTAADSAVADGASAPVAADGAVADSAVANGAGGSTTTSEQAVAGDSGVEGDQSPTDAGATGVADAVTP